MLLGHWQEMKAVGEAQNALAALAELLPDEAERVTGAGSRPSRSICCASGDMRAGAPRRPRSRRRHRGRRRVRGRRVPADRRVAPGTQAAGGHRRGRHGRDRPSLLVRVTTVGDDTALAGIQRLVADAQAAARAQALADRAAALLFYVALGAALITLIVWLLLKTPTRPSSAPSPFSSSRARTPSGWRSRSSSRELPPSEPAAASW